MRKFEIVKDFAIKYDAHEVTFPIRSTLHSAGYDFFAPMEFTVPAKGTFMIWTNIKAKMHNDEYLMMCSTSGMGKRGIRLVNSIGIVDSDYYGNENTDGNIGLMLENIYDEPYTFKKEEKIGQGIFMKYLSCDPDNVLDVKRTGGHGSTDKK